MMHYYEHKAANGDTVDVTPFCSDSCHREWCEVTGRAYEGWNGCHEGGQDNEYCAMCGVIVSTGEDSCEHQRDNVVVNRFPSEEGERCSCGLWVQLPYGRLDIGRRTWETFGKPLDSAE